MQVTSAEANKLLKKLEENKTNLKQIENEDSTYNAAVGEDIEALKPNYVFSEMQEAIGSLDRQIMNIKHAINMFNCSTEVADGLTIDQVLIRLPQLQTQKQKLKYMRSLPKMKRDRIVGNVIDYVYTSYNPEEADKEYYKVDSEISKLQLALDKINNNLTFEVNL